VQMHEHSIQLHEVLLERYGGEERADSQRARSGLSRVRAHVRNRETASNE